MMLVALGFLFIGAGALNVIGSFLLFKNGLPERSDAASNRAVLWFIAAILVLK